MTTTYQRLRPAARLFLLAIAFAPPLAAQSVTVPSDAWRTIETRHFRVHYPAPYEEWATRAAGRLESIRDAVTAEVGFAPPQTIDVIVTNHAARASGTALPFLDGPRMILYTEPPGVQEHLGAYADWIDLVAVHETAHLMHLLRPGRGWAAQAVARLLVPVGPITLGAPRWVSEGYATVIEGRLTGAGRPTSTLRALILRQWAANGQLPSYEELNGDRRFLGMRMAYLAGSAFLEWLELRSGPGSLPKLWARMTARTWPEPPQAFEDVFGAPPDELYGRFTAELTASAMTLDRAASPREGELFQELTGASGDPAVSPDGSRLAVVLRERDRPEQLVVWSTAPPAEEEREEEKRIARMLARDPQDVRPVRTKPLPRKKLHTLVMPGAGTIDTPRWTRDGGAVIFAHRVADEHGALHFDLYRWDFDRLTRLTHLADVHEADPLPDGRTAVAVRSRYGQTQLVNVDLTTGAITERTGASIDVVRSHPRVSPDGTRVAHVAQRDRALTLFIDDAAVPLPGDASSPEWISDDELVATVFTRGFAELYRVRTDGTYTQVTSISGGAFDPAPARDGRVFFTSLEPDGYAVRVLSSMEAVAAPRPYDAALVPALPPEPRAPAVFRTEPVAARPYGIGRQEPGWFAGASFAPGHQQAELGVRFGDVVGRLDTLLIGALGRDGAPSGVALATVWRGWPVEVQGHAFSVEREDEHENGLEVRALWTRRFAQGRAAFEAGALTDDLLFVTGTFSPFQDFGPARVSESLRLDVDDGHVRATADAAFRGGSFGLAARYQRDRGTPLTLGGLASTVLPRSAYAHQILDPALPAAALAGEEYDGWRIESTISRLTAFYQRHELGATRLSLVGLEVALSSDPMPILKLPGLDFTAGVARVLDAPLAGDTKWWFSMRWRP